MYLTPAHGEPGGDGGHFGLAPLRAPWSLLRSSLRILLQSTPEGFDLQGAARALRSSEGVTHVHRVHVRSLTSGRNLMSGHICVRSIAADGARVLRESTDELRQRFGVYFSTLQVEEKCLADEAGTEAIDITKQPHARA